MGRPPKYKTTKELQDAIDDYFKNGIKKRSVVVGPANNKQIVEIEIPTITGLCYHIGFESRQAFYHLEKEDKFCYTIKRARLFMEQEYEEQLQVGNTVGAIFALKNFGWIDKQSLDHSSKDGTMAPKPNIVVSDQKAADEIKKLIDEDN